MHDRAPRPTGAVRSAATIATEAVILLSTESPISQVRPRVDQSVQRLSSPTYADADALGGLRLHFSENFAGRRLEFISTTKRQL